MTEVKPLSDCRNAYEDFPDLAEAVEYLANNAGYIPLSQWHKFNDTLNATITALKSENEKMTSELRLAEEVMTDFLENPLYQVGVGGNPNRVERMINNARAALSSARAALAETEGK